MAAAVDRLYAEVEDVTGVVVASAKKTFFAGGNLTLMSQATPDDAPQIFEMVRAGQGRRCAGSRPSRGRSSPRSTAPRSAAASRSRSPPTTGSPSTTGRLEIGLPEATLGLLPGGGGVTRTVRMLGLQPALMDVLLQGPRFKPAGRPREGPGRRARRHRRGAGPGREGVDRGPPGRGPEPVGRPRLQDAGRVAEVARAGAVPAGVPGAAPQAAQGRRLPRPEGDPLGRRRGRHRSTSTPPAGSSRAT